MVKLDAIILAGGKEGSIPIQGQNKAFLPFRGRPLVGWVVAALERAETIRSITMVGPCEKSRSELAELKLTKPFHLLEQGGNIFENMWHGALSTFPGYHEGITASELQASPEADQAVVALTCDMPMLEPAEIDHFVNHLPLERADLVFGVTREEILRPFAPHGDDPGIGFIYFCAREFLVRHANIFCFRPLKLAHILETIIPNTYRLRYQRNWRNVLTAARDSITFSMPWGTLPLFFTLQFARFCHAHGLFALRDFVRKPLRAAMLENHVSKMLQTRFAYLETIGPGLTLDIDDEASYLAFLKMIDQWKPIQLEQIRRAGEII